MLGVTDKFAVDLRTQTKLPTDIIRKIVEGNWEALSEGLYQTDNDDSYDNNPASLMTDDFGELRGLLGQGYTLPLVMLVRIVREGADRVGVLCVADLCYAPWMPSAGPCDKSIDALIRSLGEVNGSAEVDGDDKVRNSLDENCYALPWLLNFFVEPGADALAVWLTHFSEPDLLINNINGNAGVKCMQAGLHTASLLGNTTLRPKQHRTNPLLTSLTSIQARNAALEQEKRNLHQQLSTLKASLGVLNHDHRQLQARYRFAREHGHLQHLQWQLEESQQQVDRIYLEQALRQQELKALAMEHSQESILRDLSTSHSLQQSLEVNYQSNKPNNF